MCYIVNISSGVLMQSLAGRELTATPQSQGDRPGRLFYLEVSMGELDKYFIESTARDYDMEISEVESIYSQIYWKNLLQTGATNNKGE